MEIDQEIYNQYRDTPFKPEELKNNQYNIRQGKKIKNPNMDEYVNYVLENIKEQDQLKGKGKSYNIILTCSLDKIKNLNKSNNSLLNNNTNDQTNVDTAKSFSKNDISFNLKLPKNNVEKEIRKKKAEKENMGDIEYNNKDDFEIGEEIENKINKDIIGNDEKHQKIFDGENNTINHYNKYNNKKGEYNNKMYYNPFSKVNNYQDDISKSQNETFNTTQNKFEDKKGKLPNIALTTFNTQPQIKKEKEKFSQFINFFSFKGRKKQDKEELKNEENEQLKTLEQNNCIIDNKKEEELNKGEKRYDFVLGKIPSKKDIINSDKDIEKLKSDLSGNEEDLNDFDKGEKNCNSDNNKCFIVKAEPIFNSDNKNDIINSSDDENNLNNSSQMIDIDKSSEYTLQTGTNIDLLIRKKSKFSPLLMGILLGSCGIFYLIYKRIKLKEIFYKISKIYDKLPGFFNYILSLLEPSFSDFMERYNDISRLFIGIICIITFWFIFKILLKLIMKRRKNIH